MLKFLSPAQLERLLSKVIALPKSFQAELSPIFSVVSNRAPAELGMRSTLLTLFNCFDQVLVTQGAKKQELRSLSNVTIRFFDELLRPSLMRMKKDFCAEHFKKIGQFFKEAFNLPYTAFKNGN